MHTIYTTINNMHTIYTPIFKSYIDVIRITHILHTAYKHALLGKSVQTHALSGKSQSRLHSVTLV